MAISRVPRPEFQNPATVTWWQVRCLRCARHCVCTWGPPWSCTAARLESHTARMPTAPVPRASLTCSSSDLVRCTEHMPARSYSSLILVPRTAPGTQQTISKRLQTDGASALVSPDEAGASRRPGFSLEAGLKLPKSNPCSKQHQAGSVTENSEGGEKRIFSQSHTKLLNKKP